MATYYSKEDLEKDMFKLGSLFKTDFCKIQGDIYRHKSEVETYTIEILGKKYDCHNYSKYNIRIPICHKPRKARKSGVMEILFGSSPKEQDELVYSNITVLEWHDYKEDKTIYVISSADYKKIRAVMSWGAVNANANPVGAYEKACKRIFFEFNKILEKPFCGENHDSLIIGDVWQVLYGYYKLKPYALTVESLDSVVEQFERQDEAYKTWKAYEPIRIAEECKYISDEIVSDFYAKGILTSSSLSNSKKIEEYKRIKEFCLKHLPELSNCLFDEDEVSSKYSEYVSEEASKTFFDNWSRINRSYNALLRGAQGEDRVAEVLKLYDDRIRIIRNYVWGYEHDFIIIAPTGIFTIEVKNLYGEYVLTETGILKSLTREYATTKDIALQSKKHLETLRRNLKECTAFNDKIPLQEIICSAEPQFSIKDEYHYLPICYYNTIDKFLLPADRVKVLTEKTMDKIEAYLLEHQEQERVYDVFLPRGEIDSRDRFINSFAEVASGVSCANKDNGINEQAQ